MTGALRTDRISTVEVIVNVINEYDEKMVNFKLGDDYGRIMKEHFFKFELKTRPTL